MFKPPQRLAWLLVAGAIMVVLTAPPALAAPDNDMFANATEISGEVGQISGSNVSATKEAGEPDHASVAGGRSIWYRWTAPADGKSWFQTAGSDMDTVLAVFTGNAVNALTLVASNDDRTLRDPTSRLSFQAVAGVVYSVAIDSFDPNKMGDSKLSWVQVPPNDDFANAKQLVGQSGVTQTNSAAATREPGEPRHTRGSRTLRSIWYKWTSPQRGTLTLTTRGSDFDTVMAIYKGQEVSDLVKLAKDDDSGRGLASRIVIGVSAGKTRKIAVAGFGNDGGNVVLRWSFAPTS